MKKQQLINILNNIKGNPEIIIWNGYVGDYQKLSMAEEIILSKDSFEQRAKYIKLENPNMPMEECRKNWMKEPYDLSNSGEKKKRTVMLQPMLRGKKSIAFGETLKY